jgi:calmodulin
MVAAGRREESESERAKRERERREFKEAQEVETLRRAFKRIDRDADQKVGPDDLLNELAFFQHKIKRPEAEKIIWEVDDDADGAVDWEEFRTMFYRTRDDQTGCEPRRLFMIVEFVMLDKNHHGIVDLDEALSVLYARYDKEGVDARVQEIVAPDDNEKTIKYAQYIDIAKHAAKAKYGSILKPGATMVPHVRSVATDGF